jgi:hypothetical protein
MLIKRLIIKIIYKKLISATQRHAYFTGGLDTRQKEGTILKLSNQLDQIKVDTEAILKNIAGII